VGGVAAKWAFLLVPAAGLLELGAHVVQVNGAVPDADWVAARAEAEKILRPDDLLTFAPSWAEPVGRHHFGDALATVERMARPDESRFPRAVEVSIRGKHTPALAGWKKAAETRTGKVTVTTWENPATAKVLEDLVTIVDGGRAAVARLDHGGAESPCPFTRTRAEAGNIGFGPAVPANRYVCPGGAFAGLTVLPDLEYVGRRCVYAPPPGGASATRLRFTELRFGARVHGHHGIAVHNERDRTGAPVILTFRAPDARVLARFVHNDGDGWKGFEFETPELAGKTAELWVDVSSQASGRQYCFEADTR